LKAGVNLLLHCLTATLGAVQNQIIPIKVLKYPNNIWYAYILLTGTKEIQFSFPQQTFSISVGISLHFVQTHQSGAWTSGPG
jgi:hypothetical protein